MTAPAAPPGQQPQPQPQPGQTAAEIAAAYAIYQIITSAMAQAGRLFDITSNAVQRAWIEMSNAGFTVKSQDQFISGLVPILTAAQNTAASTTQAYLANAVREMTGSLPPKASPGQYDTESIRGVSPDVVYRRPITTNFVKQKTGMTPDQANHAGLIRALQTGLADVQLARNHAAQDLLKNDTRLAGYRRVLGPNPNHCAMCIVASTVLYSHRTLMSMHPGCQCTIAPVYGNTDPGTRLNAAKLTGTAIQIGTNKHDLPVYSPDDLIDLGDVLGEVHEAIADRFGKSYRDARGIDYRKVMVTHEHGEMGPIMWVTGDRFTNEQHLTGDYAAQEGTFDTHQARRDQNRAKREGRNPNE